MQYYKGDIFNKKGLIFKDGKYDTRLYGHPVVVLNDVDHEEKMFFLKMVSDVTRLIQCPNRYVLIKNNKANGLDKPSLICLDEVYCSTGERAIARGELSLEEYKNLVNRLYEVNSQNDNNDEICKQWLECMGDIETYLNEVVSSW